MILPIGHGEFSTRRLPWVTFGIMAMCLAALLATGTYDLEPGPDRDTMMLDAEGYWRNHAYLDAAPEIRTRVGYDVSPNQRRQYLSLMESQALDVAPDDPEVWAAEQAELDRLTEFALGEALPAELLEADNPYRTWGLIPGDIRFVTLISYMFMHAGWLHLLSNFFMLFLAGPPVEDRLGRPLFAAFYAGAGVFAALFWAMFATDPNIPLVGASGAVSGVLGAFLVRFWSTDIRFAYFFMFGFRPIYGTFEAKAMFMLPLWFANELFQGWLARALGVSDGVAYWAHVGGFVFGAAAVLGIRLLKVEEKYIDGAIESKVTLAEANPLVEEALAVREQGDHAGALAMLQNAWRENPADRDLALALWDSSRLVDQPELGAGAMAALVRLTLSDGDERLAIQHWMDLQQSVPTALVDPNTLFKLSTTLREEGDEALAQRALAQSVDPGIERVSPGIALRVVELTRDSDPPTALRAARRALESADLHEAKRARIEATVRELEASGVSEAPDVVEQETVRRAEAANREIEVPASWEDETAVLPVAMGAAVAGAASQPAATALPPPLPSASPPPLPAVGAQPPPLPPPAALSAEGELVTDFGGGSSDELDEGFDIALEGVVDAPRFSGTKLVEALPTSLESGVLRMKVSPDRKAKLEYEKIEAVSVAAVHGLGPKPVLLIDLLLNWTSLDDVPLRIIRLKSSEFDPRTLVDGAADPKSALRALVSLLLERSGAVPLPSAEAVKGAPFEVFDDLDAYQQEVLQVAP